MEAGYIYGLMGENGAGKTTLMNYILNETILYEGHIYIEGIDIRTARAQALNHIGFVSEENPFLRTVPVGRMPSSLAYFMISMRKTRFIK